MNKILVIFVLLMVLFSISCDNRSPTFQNTPLDNAPSSPGLQGISWIPCPNTGWRVQGALTSWTYYNPDKKIDAFALTPSTIESTVGITIIWSYR
jgi:hypothetical protein